MELSRNKRRILEGVVMSNKMDKTVTVWVTRKFRHPIYEKLVRKRTKCYAHDETNALQIGQKVRIMQCRPFSKMKKWRVISVIEEK